MVAVRTLINIINVLCNYCNLTWLYIYLKKKKKLLASYPASSVHGQNFIIIIIYPEITRNAFCHYVE